MSTWPPLTVDEARAAGREINAYCGQLPLMREYLQLRNSWPAAVPFFNTTAWHARGEQIVIAALLSGAAIGPERWPDGTPPITFGRAAAGTDDDSFEARAVFLAGMVVKATPFLWSHRVLQTLLASPPLPSHVISPTILPHKVMFWTLESSYTLAMGATPETSQTGGMLNWLLVFEIDGGIAVVYDESASRITHYQLQGGIIKYGQQYPEGFPQIAGAASVTDLVLKFLAFLRSPYIHTDAELIERPVRRRCAKVNAVEANKPVHVVLLRRPHDETPTPEGQATTAGGSDHWQHQWWVQGHYRAQWYASERAHHVIWIEPHLKGPSDKPVLEKVYAVKR